jgi:hypothetical protein
VDRREKDVLIVASESRAAAQCVVAHKVDFFERLVCQALPLTLIKGLGEGAQALHAPVDP